MEKVSLYEGSAEIGHHFKVWSEFQVNTVCPRSLTHYIQNIQFKMRLNFKTKKYNFLLNPFDMFS